MTPIERAVDLCKAWFRHECGFDRKLCDGITCDGPIRAMKSAREGRDAMTDRHVEAVRAKLLERAKVGLRKYGVTTERGDLTPVQWLRHAQEEALDLAVYLERLMGEFE